MVTIQEKESARMALAGISRAQQAGYPVPLEAIKRYQDILAAPLTPTPIPTPKPTPTPTPTPPVSQAERAGILEALRYGYPVPVEAQIAAGLRPAPPTLEAQMANLHTVESTLAGLEEKARATGSQEDWAAYERYYKQDYTPAFAQVKTAQEKYAEEVWATFSRELKGAGLTDENLRTIKANWEYIMTHPRYKTPEERQRAWEDYIGQWGCGPEGVRRSLKGKSISELLAFEKSVEQVEGYEIPLGVVKELIEKDPWWQETKKLYESGEWRDMPRYKGVKTFEEFYNIRREWTIEKAEWWKGYQEERGKTPPWLGVYKPAAEMAAFAGVGYVGATLIKTAAPYLAAAFKTVTIDPLTKLIPYMGPAVQASWEAAKIAAPVTLAQIGVTVSPYAAQALGQTFSYLYARTAQQMYEMPRYSEKDIELRKAAMQKAGYTEAQIEEEEKKLRATKAYTPIEIASILAKQAGLSLVLMGGIRAGLEAEPLIRTVRLGEEQVWKGLWIRQPVVGKTPYGWTWGYPKGEVAAKLTKQYFVPVIEKAIYTPEKMFETKFAFKVFAPNLPPELAGVKIVWTQAGKVYWISPTLFKEIVPSLNEQFVRTGMVKVDASNLINYISGVKKQITVFGSTSKMLQWAPEIWVPKEWLAHDLDIMFLKHGDFLTFVEGLKTKFAGKVLIDTTIAGTVKVKTLTGGRLLDIHSPLSPYTFAKQQAWGYPLQFQTFTPEGWKISTLGSEHIHELSTHGWTKIGDKIVFASARIKDTARMIISGYTIHGEAYRKSAEFLITQLIAQGVPKGQIPALLAETAKVMAKEAVLLYAPPTPTPTTLPYFPVIYPTLPISPLPALSSVVSNVNTSASLVTRSVMASIYAPTTYRPTPTKPPTYPPTRVPTGPTYPSVSSLLHSTYASVGKSTSSASVSVSSSMSQASRHVSSAISRPSYPSYPPSPYSYHSYYSAYSSSYGYPYPLLSESQWKKLPLERKKAIMVEIARRRYFPIGMPELLRGIAVAPLRSAVRRGQAPRGNAAITELNRLLGVRRRSPRPRRRKR